MWIHEPTPEEIAHPKACKSCGASIVFAKTKADKLAPLNAGFKILRTQQVGGVELAEVESGASHFSTCPQKQQFRRRK